TVTAFITAATSTAAGC
ncbi:hypothetical protein D039_2565B, partial [Vibrio parahaemolyticus EKP-028]